MTINFTKAIELQTVRKLKSHAKVGYQDHPNGDKACAGCSMFIPGNPPACSHVAPPIAAHGYCDDYEPLDANARARAAIGKARSFAAVMKDGPPDEARDAQGRWTAGGGGDKKPSGTGRIGVPSSYRDPYRRSHGSARPYIPGAEIPRARGEEQVRQAEQKVKDLQRQLSDQPQDKSDDLYWGIHHALQQARADLEALKVKVIGKYAPSVSDVHPPTALGNEAKKRPKWSNFLTTLAEIKGGGRIVQINEDSSPEWVDNPEPDGPPVVPSQATDFGKALAKIKADALAGARYMADHWHPATGTAIFYKQSVPVLFMRHGPTRFNNQTDMSKDRVRSWNNVPLTADGIEDAEKAGEKLKDEGVGYIVSSDLGRAVQTSKIVGKAVGIKPVHDYGMRPWNLGKFTGQSTDEAHDGILDHVENPDKVVDGGESFNMFKARAVQAMLSHIKKAGKKRMLVVSHHRNERLFASMRPDGTNDPKKFMKTGEDPGDFTEMEFDAGELQNALKRAQEGQGEQKVGKVWGSNAELPDSVRNVLPDEAQTVFRRVANDRMQAGHSEVSSIKQAWTAVKNGWSKTDSGKWVRKSWLGQDGIYEFVEAELAKLGGESSIAEPTNEINASLQLTALDERNARSPFPYDQYFFANLRNDQKERLLAALTDQDSLPEKVVRLSDLSSIQDRVDPNKVQSMLEGAPEKLPVVVRVGAGRYGIADGHHRLTAAFLSGVKTVPVKFLDIEAFDPRVHTDANPGSKGEPVDKGFGITFDVRKTDEDQQLVFGWASICSIGGEDVVDKQDDVIPEDELEKAAYDFALYCRQQGDMHERMGVGRLVESMMFTKQKQEAIGIDLGMVGWWVGFKVDDPGVWKRIKSGDLPEFSIGGKARREVMDFEKALGSLTAARARDSIVLAKV